MAENLSSDAEDRRREGGHQNDVAIPTGIIMHIQFNLFKIADECCC